MEETEYDLGRGVLDQEIGVEEYEVYLVSTTMDAENQQIIYTYDKMEPPSSEEKRFTTEFLAKVPLDNHDNYDQGEVVAEEMDDNEPQVGNGCDEGPPGPFPSSSNPPCEDMGIRAIYYETGRKRILLETKARHLTVAHNCPSVERKMSQKSPSMLVKTVDEDFNVRLEFKDFQEGIDDKLVMENGTNQEVFMIIPEDEGPSNLTLSDEVVNVTEDVQDAVDVSVDMV